MINQCARRAVIAGFGVCLLSACGSSTDKGTPTATTTVPSSTSTTTRAAAPATAPRASTTTTTTRASGPVPAPVTGVQAGPAGGSGEIQVDWNAVADATGYRVYRSSTPSGPFLRMADVNLRTGKVTAVESVRNIYSDNQTFYPLVQATPAPSTPAREFHYVESPTPDRKYYRVTAYNPNGESAPSAVDCGAPVTKPQC